MWDVACCLTTPAYRGVVNSWAQLYDMWIGGLGICHCGTDLQREQKQHRVETRDSDGLSGAIMFD